MGDLLATVEKDSAALKLRDFELLMTPKLSTDDQNSTELFYELSPQFNSLVDLLYKHMLEYLPKQKSINLDEKLTFSFCLIDISSVNV